MNHRILQGFPHGGAGADSLHRWIFAAAIMVILAALLVPLRSTTAKAEQSADTGIRFARHDIRGRSEAGIITAAASSSKHGVSLIVRTTDKDVWKTALDAAVAVARQGYPVSFVLAADGPDRLEVYAKSIEIGNITNPGVGVSDERLRQDIRSEMTRAYDLTFGSE